MKQKRTQPGFTLVEMMVAVSIFATISVIVADLFVMANRAQRRTNAGQQIQSDARVIFAQMEDRIRAGKIDYAGYGGTVPSVTDTLRILDERGNTIIMRKSDATFSNTVCATAQSTPCLEISQDAGATFTPMTSAQVRVAGVQFYIDPPQSPTTPSGSGFAYDIQPRVTAVIGLRGVSNQAVEQGTTFIQTTVSSRALIR